MKYLILILGLLAMPLRAATYYVSTGGSDSNPGSSGSPWLTVSHAAATCAGGDTILIADGTYAESTYLNLAKSYASMVVFASQSGNKTNVIIRGTGGTYNTLMQGSFSGNTTFSNLTFATHAIADTYGSIFVGSSVTAVILANCLIITTNDGTHAPNALYLSGGNTVANFQCLGCLIQNTGASTTANAILEGSAYMTNIMFSGCQILSSGNGINANTANRFEQLQATNCTIVATNGIAINAANTIGIIWLSGCTLQAPGQDLYLNGVSNCVVTGCNLYNTNASQALVTCYNVTNLSILGSTLIGAANTSFGVVDSKSNPGSNLLVRGCVFNTGKDAVALAGTASASVISNTIIVNSTHGISLGEDLPYNATYAGYVANGVIQGNTITATNAHGVLIGANASNVVATANVVNSLANYGIVEKSCVNSTSAWNTVYAYGPMIFKEAIRSCFTHNLFICTSPVVTDQAGQTLIGDTSNHLTNCVVTWNTFLGSPKSAMWGWAMSSDDNGNSVLDYNRYYPGILSIGTNSIYGTNVASSIEAWRNGYWTTYGTTNALSVGNETHSYYGSSYNVGLTQ